MTTMDIPDEPVTELPRRRATTLDEVKQCFEFLRLLRRLIRRDMVLNCDGTFTLTIQGSTTDYLAAGIMSIGSTDLDVVIGQADVLDPIDDEVELFFAEADVEPDGETGTDADDEEIIQWSGRDSGPTTIVININRE